MRPGGLSLQDYSLTTRMEISSILTRDNAMDQMSEEDRKRILESSPIGTLALMSAVIGGMVIAWLFLYYGVFLPRG